MRDITPFRRRRSALTPGELIRNFLAEISWKSFLIQVS